MIKYFHFFYKILDWYSSGDEISILYITTTLLPNQRLLTLLINKSLTQRGLVSRYGDIGLGQHWLRLWLAWRHKAITWTNVTLLINEFRRIYLRAISQWVSQMIFYMMSLKIVLLKFLPYIPGAYELISPILYYITIKWSGIINMDQMGDCMPH